MRNFSCLSVALFACSSQTSTVDAGHVAPPSALYSEASPLKLPSGLSTVDALAVDASTHTLYVASGAVVLRDDIVSPSGFVPVAMLAANGITTVTAMRAITGGGLLVASSDHVITIAADGSTGAALAYQLPFPSGGFGGGALVALGADGAAMYAVEGGGGSTGASGQPAIHVASFDLHGSAPLVATSTFELAAPFELVPSTTAAINASATVVSDDGSLLYVAHVVLRDVFAVQTGGSHTVTKVDTDSLQRSATAMSIDGDVLTQVAVFDQTVPVFRLNDAHTAVLAAEIPIGQAPGAIASYQRRVVVSMTSGSGMPGGPPGGDAGVPGTGGSGAPDGGLPPPGDGGTEPAIIRVFDLAVAP